MIGVEYDGTCWNVRVFPENKELEQKLKNWFETKAYVPVLERVDFHLEDDFSQAQHIFFNDVWQFCYIPATFLVGKGYSIHVEPGYEGESTVTIRFKKTMFEANPDWITKTLVLKNLFEDMENFAKVRIYEASKMYFERVLRELFKDQD